MTYTPKTGTSTADYLIAGDGVLDSIVALGGNDTIVNVGGADIVIAGTGSDTLERVAALDGASIDGGTSNDGLGGIAVNVLNSTITGGDDRDTLNVTGD